MDGTAKHCIDQYMILFCNCSLGGNTADSTRNLLWRYNWGAGACPTFSILPVEKWASGVTRAVIVRLLIAAAITVCQSPESTSIASLPVDCYAASDPVDCTEK